MCCYVKEEYVKEEYVKKNTKRRMRKGEYEWQRILKALDEIRPMLQRDGGDVEFVDYTTITSCWPLRRCDARTADDR